MLSKPAILPEIEKVVSLKKSGVNYFGCCPFHEEKTPSFSVNSEKEIFHCFGCGVSGDVIDFVQKYYNLDFLKAIKHLEIKTTKIEYSKIKEKQELKNHFRTWESGYFQEICMYLRIFNKLLKYKLSWSNREIIYKSLPVCEYHADIIQNGTDKLKYELYKDLNKQFDYRLTWG